MIAAITWPMAKVYFEVDDITFSKYFAYFQAIYMHKKFSVFIYIKVTDPVQLVCSKGRYTVGLMDFRTCDLQFTIHKMYNTVT